MKEEKKTHDSSFLYNGVKFSIHTRTRFSLKCININLYFWEIYNTQQTLLHPTLNHGTLGLQNMVIITSVLVTTSKTVGALTKGSLVCTQRM